MRGFVLLSLLLLSLFLRDVLSAPASAEILSLPGLNAKLNFKQYGGYVNVNSNAGRNLYYWFVESQSNPSTDPLILWLQGGPGCSSLFGFLTEHGPFKITPTLGVVLNPYSWNQNANVLYLESPAGVGFSYNSNGVYNNGDNTTMQDAYNFLQGWFKLYPEYLSNDFYVTGESYGGHYVPQLSWTIINENKVNAQKINIKGMLVGNPWTDDNIDTWSVPPFIFYHHLCSLPTWEAVEAACLNNGSLDVSQPFSDIKPRRLRGIDESCNDALDAMYNEMGNDINQYDIYAACLEGAGLDCSNYTAETDYLNTPSVQTAIHANKPAEPWAVCSDVNYNNAWDSVLPIYAELMESIHVATYTGDVTFNVPALGTQVWVEGFKRNVVSDYQPWLVGGQVAGYYKKFDGITYITVKNSGHMVPYYTPVQGQALLANYLAGTF